MTVADPSLYFAYGSNMSSQRLHARIPGAIRMGGACLDGWVLRFHKPSRDGSSKADIIPVTGDHAKVWGVLWSLGDDGWRTMDQLEGEGYERISLLVLDADGDTLRVTAYRATHTDPKLAPYDWYREHAVRGAIEAGLPPEYVVRLRSITSREDPDPDRAMRELAIYDAN